MLPSTPIFYLHSRKHPERIRFNITPEPARTINDRADGVSSELTGVFPCVSDFRPKWV
ncbi:hypothetical protein [Scytonema sp. PRP1]|jgi:hypothetical protein|uniref:hypothetical protein n=1 Tax=Scytonema sp. PRP1 TaxID=3120513 RepID=UPI00300DBC70